MKISSKLIGTIVEEMAGKDVANLAIKMKDRKNVSEITLAKNIKKEVNETRNLLYKLHNSNLVSFVKKKDNKKGWYIYHWTLNNERICDFGKKNNEKKLEKLKSRLIREREGNFFGCRNGCLRASFENAVDLQFKCNECGELLMQDDNGCKIKEIEKEIKNMESKVKV